MNFYACAKTKMVITPRFRDKWCCGGLSTQSLPCPPRQKTQRQLFKTGFAFGTVGDGSTSRKINYPGTGNFSAFVFDPSNRFVQIKEVSGGVTQATDQFVWASGSLCENRNASGAVVARYVSQGQVTTQNYFFTTDHLGSVTELCSATGQTIGQFAYDSYGRPINLISSAISAFQFGQYYLHRPSGLNLTLTRAYSAALGRWINRDPSEEEGGVNLYAYLENEPVNSVDHSGEQGITEFRFPICWQPPKVPPTPPPPPEEGLGGGFVGVGPPSDGGTGGGGGGDGRNIAGPGLIPVPNVVIWNPHGDRHFKDDNARAKARAAISIDLTSRLQTGQIKLNVPFGFTFTAPDGTVYYYSGIMRVPLVIEVGTYYVKGGVG